MFTKHLRSLRQGLLGVLRIERHDQGFCEEGCEDLVRSRIREGSVTTEDLHEREVNDLRELSKRMDHASEYRRTDLLKLEHLLCCRLVLTIDPLCVSLNRTDRPRPALPLLQDDRDLLLRPLLATNRQELCNQNSSLVAGNVLADNAVWRLYATIALEQRCDIISL
jgi:hypothetical protein